MIVELSGYSGAGKSVLQAMLDGHPDIYVHPFHDNLHLLLKGVNEKEDWFVHKDIPGLRSVVNKNVSYTKLESHSLHGYRNVDFSSSVQLKFKVNFDFYETDKNIFKKVFSLDSWDKQTISYVFINNFKNAIDNKGEQKNISCFLGPLNTEYDKAKAVLDIYKDSKKIIIERDLKSIIATRLGRKPNDINYNSAILYNQNFESLVSGTFLKKAVRHNFIVQKIKEEYPERVKIVRFEDVINKTEEIATELAEFIGVSFNPIMLKPSTMGNTIQHNGVSYTDVELDNPNEILNKKQINKINKKQKQYLFELKHPSLSMQTYRSKIKKGLRTLLKV